MKKTDIEKVIETLYAKKLTNEANLIGVLLHRVEEANPVIEEMLEYHTTLQEKIKKGNTRKSLLEAVYQSSLSMITSLNSIKILEEE